MTSCDGVLLLEPSSGPVSTGMTQREFAEQYRFNLRHLQDLEQGWTERDSALEAYLKLIEHDPKLLKRILDAA